MGNGKICDHLRGNKFHFNDKENTNLFILSLIESYKTNKNYLITLFLSDAIERSSNMEEIFFLELKSGENANASTIKKSLNDMNEFFLNSGFAGWKKKTIKQNFLLQNKILIDEPGLNFNFISLGEVRGGIDRYKFQDIQDDISFIKFCKQKNTESNKTLNFLRDFLYETAMYSTALEHENYINNLSGSSKKMFNVQKNILGIFEKWIPFTKKIIDEIEIKIKDYNFMIGLWKKIYNEIPKDFYKDEKMKKLETFLQKYGKLLAKTEWDEVGIINIYYLYSEMVDDSKNFKQKLEEIMKISREVIEHDK